tara:strand:+ start:809 stop:1036 length:228 start_codon:yes stop_codon:yes gene_type:complete
MKEERKFKSNTMMWDDGDMPECSYCGKDFDSAESLHETCFSGGLVCEDEDCRHSLIEEMLSEEVAEIDENFDETN